MWLVMFSILVVGVLCVKWMVLMFIFLSWCRWNF